MALELNKRREQLCQVLYIINGPLIKRETIGQLLEKYQIKISWKYHIKLLLKMCNFLKLPFIVMKSVLK